MPTAKRRQRSAAEIDQILRDLATSGLSRRQFAADRGISLSTLQSWIAKTRNSDRSEQPDLVPIGTIGRQRSALIEIELVSGEILRVGPGCHDEDLRLVLTELRRC